MVRYKSLLATIEQDMAKYKSLQLTVRNKVVIMICESEPINTKMHEADSTARS